MNFTTNTWDSLSIFYSASTTKKYLYRYYTKEAISDSKLKSFENAPIFIHYLKSAETYYKEAVKVPFEIQPVLLFYGYIQLIKACLLSIDPYYPSSATLLAHGVTTRKKKKQQFQFLKDEVKIQRNGLFSHMSSKMFHVERLENEKVIMEDLLYCLPELSEQFQFFSVNNCFKLHQQNDNQYITDYQCLDNYHLTADRLASYLSTARSSLKLTCQEQGKQLLFQFEKPLSMNYHQPFHFNSEHNHFALIGKMNSLPFSLNEILIHYLLLYNLSMIARYETDWWMDLIASTPNEDYPLIKRFLNITLYKAPLLIKEWLFNDRDLLYMD